MNVCSHAASGGFLGVARGDQFIRKFVAGFAIGAAGFFQLDAGGLNFSVIAGGLQAFESSERAPVLFERRAIRFSCRHNY